MIIDSLWKRLNHLVPEPQCRTFGNDYSRIEWNDARPMPTAEELLAIDVDLDWESKRRAAYPSVDDQLDALWKGGAEHANMKAKIAKVKADYPKP